MKGVKSEVGMVVKFCIVTGLPADKSKFYRTLKRISPALADLMTEEVECAPNV